MPRYYYIDRPERTEEELEAIEERLEHDRVQERIEAVKRADEKAQKSQQMGKTLVGKGFVELYYNIMRAHIKDVLDAGVVDKNNIQPVHVQLCKDLHAEFAPIWEELIDVFTLTILDSLTEALVLPREYRTEKETLVNTVVWRVRDTLVREMEYRSYLLKIKADENVNDKKIQASFQAGIDQRRDEKHKSIYTHFRIRHDTAHTPVIFEREDFYALLTKIVVEFAEGWPFRD